MKVNRWAALGLAVLTLLTATLVVLAFLHVRPRNIAVEPAAAQPPAGGSATGVTSPPVVTTTPRSASPSPSARPRERSTDSIRTMLREENELKIVVLGDASGEGDSAWVQRWAQRMAANRQVELRTGTGSSRSFGDGPRSTTLTNASSRDLTLRDVADRFDQLVPAETDLVVLNFGHRENRNALSGDLDRVWKRIPASAAAMVILQNPEQGQAQQVQRDRIRDITEWARTNKAPTINVFDAFVRAPEPLAELLQRDGQLPSEAGSRVWMEELVKQVG